MTLLGADGHVMVAAAAPPHLLECPQHKLPLWGRDTNKRSGYRCCQTITFD